MNAPEKLSLFDLSAWSARQLDAIEQALSQWVANSQTGPVPAGLGDAMRYAVLDGGKRLRPLLVMAACEAVGGNAEAALRAACAVELIHAYSLVHDDMPCMDNDVLRRGKPTVHVKFGEAQALLAGDALQALAFELLTPAGEAISAPVQAALCRLLAQAAGCQGMAGGQAIDLASVGLPLTSAQLHEMHRLKTGALLQASVLMGAAVMAVSNSATVSPGETQPNSPPFGALPSSLPSFATSSNFAPPAMRSFMRSIFALASASPTRSFTRTRMCRTLF